jgi:tetratricopeptide (TPR) repeat protein
MELDPDLRFLHLNIGWAYAHRGMHDSAIQEWWQYWQQNPKAYHILNAAYRTSGYQGYLEALLGREVAAAFSPFQLSHYQRAVILTELGRTNYAFHSLEKAITEQDDDLEELLVDADLEKLRSDQRFPKLVARCRAECGASRPF